MDSSTSFDGPEFDFLSYLDTSKFDLPIGTSPQDDQHQQLMSGLLLGQGVGQGQGGNAKAQYSSTGTSSTLDPGAAAVLAALSPSSSSASASSASGGSPLFGNLSYSSNSNSNSNGNNSGTGLAFSTKFAGFNGSGFGGNAYQSSLAAAGSTSGNSSHTDAGSSSGGSPPFDASMYGQQQQRQSARTMPDQKLFGDFSFANHLSPQSEHWQQAYMQQALAALSAQNSNGISDAAIQQFLHSSQPNSQMLQNAGPQQGQHTQAQVGSAAGCSMFVSPTSAPEQTPSLSSNSNIGSPLSDSSFSNVNYPPAGSTSNMLRSSLFNQQLESIDERRMSIATNGSSYGSPQIAQSQQFMGGDLYQSMAPAPASVLAPMHSLQPHSAPAHGYSQRDQQFLHLQQQQQQQQRPVARLPSGATAASAQQPNVGLVPASVAHHMPSVAKRHAAQHGKDASVIPATANLQQMHQPAEAGAEVIPKTSLKRSYQQAIKQEDPTDGQGFIDMQAAIMKKSESSGSDEGDKENSAEGSGSKRTTGGHNAVEQKYRRGINDSLIMLREIVPALGHLRAVPGSAPSKRKMSQFSLAAAATPAAPEGFVDGVMAPKKLSKQLILVTATDYIRYLKSKRDELEGELENLKVTLEDCVDDASVVMNLHEQRWAPERARMAKEREAIHEDRISAKEESRKKAKLDKLERKKAQAAAGGGAVSGGAAGNGKESDDDASEDDDEEDMDMDDDAAPAASTSAVPAKSQARARAKTAKKPPAAGRNPGNAAARRGSAVVPQSHSSDASAPGPPKALMSVFAGVSFLGGAGYDMVYGATANSHGPSGTVPNSEAPRVWSHGLVKRSAMPTSAYLASEHAANSLHPVQTFFLERPALLSGLVMLSIALITGYFFLHLVPSAARQFAGYNREGRKQRGRELLVRAAMDPSKVTQDQQRRALATLAGAPSSPFLQVVQTPGLLLALATTYAFGSRAPTSFTNQVDQAGLERAASAIRLLEADFTSAALDTREGKLAAFTSFCSLFILTRSATWPESKASLPLLIRAEAVLALVAPTVLPSASHASSRFASSLWAAAQARAKKDDDASLHKRNSSAWASMALQLSLDDARRALASAPPSPSSRPLLLRIAEVRSEATLLSAWKSLFVTVANATTSSAASPSNSASTTPTLASKAVFMQPPSSASSEMQTGTAALDDLLSALPSNSPLVALAILAKGVVALGSGDVISATRVAVAVSSPAAQQLESVRAFRELIAGIAAGTRVGRANISDPSSRSVTMLSSIDTLAYTTISWLAVRQASLAVRPETSSGPTEKGTADEADEEDQVQLNASLQIASVQLRKLFASPIFTTDAAASSADVSAAKADTEAFLDAQERCVETLVAIGRKAAGLDALSDSGTEQ